MGFILTLVGPSKVDAARFEVPKPAACATSPTIIKGNIARKKKRLYYIATHRSYKQVKINRKGERWFCTEAEARAAGWTAAPASKRRKWTQPIHDTADYVVPTGIEKPGCDIKGNVSRDARRYHMRGTLHYAETKVSKVDGDQWFCSEQEAHAAGFEKAGTYLAGQSRLDAKDCVVPEAPSRPPGCTIKGNISRSGKIYHVLGSYYYAETQVTQARGERWFCSRQEAEASGWREPKNAREPLVCPLVLNDTPGESASPPDIPKAEPQSASAD